MTISIRDLASTADYHACCALQESTWGPGFREIVPPAILQVSQKLGGVAAGAFDADGTLIGFVFGMTGLRNGVVVHWSDMLAVRPEYRGRHIGQQLKRYQRERVIAVGATTMYWTYDPLVARNAHLNILRLHAMPVEYIVNMYGTDTGSALHGTVPTDRFVVAWDLHASQAPANLADVEEHTICNPLVAGVPVPVPEVSPSAPRLGVQIPDSDVGSLSHNQLTAWRLSVRAAVQRLFQEGYRITNFVSSRNGALPYYVFER